MEMNILQTTPPPTPTPIHNPSTHKMLVGITGHKHNYYYKTETVPYTSHPAEHNMAIGDLFFAQSLLGGVRLELDGYLYVLGLTGAYPYHKRQEFSLSQKLIIFSSFISLK